jgi:predicted DNA-binding transcriptional regulator AlpA
MTEWLTSSDVANKVGVEVRTIYKYRERKSMPEHDAMIGNKPVWKQTTIDDWIVVRESHLVIDDRQMIDENEIYYSNGVN